ncbi:MAG: dienelactone hydrolase family protein [Burkholderiales bacterium]
MTSYSRKLLALALAITPLLLCAQEAQETFVPPGGRGTALVAVSGQSGVAQYREHAAKLAGAGFFVVLIDGKDILFRTAGSLDPAGRVRLRKVLSDAVADPRSSSRKAVLLGYSLGGGGVVQWGLAEDELVSRAVLFYPVVSRPGQDMTRAASEVRYPVLLLAGAQDKYMNCCLIETMQLLQAEAKKRSAPLELVVYPHADHAFNLPGAAFRPEDAADSWTRMSNFLIGR